MNKTIFKNSKVHKCFFNKTSLIEADFSNCDLLETTFHNCNLSKSNFCNAINYDINPLVNNIKKAKFSLPEAVGLLRGFDIIIK